MPHIWQARRVKTINCHGIHPVDPMPPYSQSREGGDRKALPVPASFLSPFQGSGLFIPHNHGLKAVAIITVSPLGLSDPSPHPKPSPEGGDRKNPYLPRNRPCVTLSGLRWFFAFLTTA